MNTDNARRPSYTSNVLAGLVRSGAVFLPTIAFGILIPRAFDEKTFNAWTASFQFAAYGSLFEFGIGSVTARSVASELSSGGINILATMRASRRICYMSAAAGACVVAAGVELIPILISEIDGPLLREARLILLAIGIATVFRVATTHAAGFLVGMLRYDIVAVCTIAGQAIGFAVAWLIVRRSAAASTTAFGFMSGLLIGSWLLLFAARRLQTTLPRDLHAMSPSALTERTAQQFRELRNSVLAMSTWTLSAALVGSLDLIIVGRYDFAAIGAYGIALTLTLALTAGVAAATNPLLPRLASMRTNHSGLKTLVVRSTRIAAAGLGTIGLLFHVAARPILGEMFGAPRGRQIAEFAVVLIWATCIRQLAAPFSLALVAVGRNRLVALSPVIEGVTNLCLSVVLSQEFGAIGVAYGTLIGAFISIGFHRYYNWPRSSFNQIPDHYAGPKRAC